MPLVWMAGGAVAEAELPLWGYGAIAAAGWLISGGIGWWFDNAYPDPPWGVVPYCSGPPRRWDGGWTGGDEPPSY